MNHKTLTDLKQLRIGDSFVFPKRTDVWRVMALANKSGKVAINQVVNNKPVYKHDELKRGSTTVMFLRHTVPVAGEEIYMEDLVAGDVFFKDDDIIHEWEVVETGHDFWTVRRLDQAASGKAGRLAKVTFVRHKQ